MESDLSEGLSHSIGAYKRKSCDDTTITSGDKMNEMRKKIVLLQNKLNETRKKIVLLQNELNKYKVKGSIAGKTTVDYPLIVVYCEVQPWSI